jgi:peptidyl-prolyl cis-trans isomerase D
MAYEPGKPPATRTKKHVARLERERQQSRIILYVFIGILSAVVLLLAYGYLDIKVFQLRKPVAKVGETEILANQFEPRVRLQRQQLLGQYNQYAQYGQIFGMDVEDQLRQIQSKLDAPTSSTLALNGITSVGEDVLNQLINEEIIRQEAEKRGITVSEEEIQKEMQTTFDFYPNGSPTPSLTPTQLIMPEIPAESLAIVSLTPTATQTPRFTATPGANETPQPSATPTNTLAPTLTPTAGPSPTPLPTSTPYTLEGFENQFTDAKDSMVKLGFTEASYRNLFEIQVLQTKLREEITADVPQTQKQVWARHILVSDAALAVTVIERLKNGDDFAALALELSEDTGSAVNGGDLGWFGNDGTMVAEFATAAFALEKPGDFTQEPVQSQFGYHIIQLIAKQDRPLTQEQFEAAKDKAFQDWLTAAREEYNVETFDFWKERTPSEPNFITMATDSANAQNTALIDERNQTQTAQAPTATP